jgi:multifunctional methyltransferase subunit TRM112
MISISVLCCLKCDTFPLRIKATNKQEDEQDQNTPFLIHMLPKLDYEAIKLAAQDLGIEGLPDKLPDDVQNNEQAIHALHKLLLEVHVVEGDLECTKCGRVYPVKQGIPNMVLREDEVKMKI